MKRFRKLLIALVLLASTILLAPVPAQTQGFPGNPMIPFVGIPRRTGRIWYVDGTLGNDSNSCTNPATACKTITAGYGHTASGRGDVIYIYPGTYAENLVIAKDEISLISTSVNGNAKRVAVAPASGIALDCQNTNRFHASGIRFVGVSAVGVKSRCEGALFDNDDFTSDTTHGFQFGPATSVAGFTGSGTIFFNCLFRENGGAGLRTTMGTGAALGLYATNVRVLNSEFYLNTGDDIDDDSPGGPATTFSQWRITGNYFMTKNKTTVFYLDMDGGTGSTETQINGNYFSADDLSSTQIKISTGMSFVGNYAFGNGIVTELTP